MKLLVLDGNSILNRAFYGIKVLTTKDGVYTNAIYGFLNMFLKLYSENNPDAVAIAFDVRAKTFRHKAYDGYKAKRKGMPDELASQLPILKELLGFLGYKIVECEGFEADDILGTLANSCEKTGNECVIATGDRDSLQLISKHVIVKIASTKMGKPEVTIYDEDKVNEVYGLSPKQLIDVKAIQGDTSDNIPGVPGIGEKGALDLIKRFNSIEYIYDNLDTIDIKDGIRKKLIAGKDSAFMSKMLGTIRLDVPIDTDINSYIIGTPCKKQAVDLMKKLEFFSMIPKFNLEDESAVQTKKNKDIKIINSPDLNILVDKIRKNKKLIFNTVYANENISNFEFIIDDTIFIVDYNEASKDIVKSIFEDENILKQTNNSKELFLSLERLGIDAVAIDFDISLCAYLLNPSSKSYDVLRLCSEYEVDTSYVDDNSTVFVFPELIDKLYDKLKSNDQITLLKEIEIPLAKVLASMENIGFKVDYEGLKGYSKMLDEKIISIESEIYEMAGCKFNINSPKQLSNILFDKMQIKATKKNKSGYSTSAEVLEELKYDYPIVSRILEFRTFSKLKSTYCDGLLKVIAKDGRVHTKFNQTETRTGRISSTEPNLQNIPVRTDIGRELRKFFLAKDGCTLVDADYSQIELRVLAHVSHDKNMINAFKNNEDIHTITACEVFHTSPLLMTPLIRSRAKAVNFGIVYGISAFSLSKDISVTKKEAERYINGYLSHYSGVASYMKNIVDFAKNNGYVKTIFNRRRYLPEISSSNYNLRSFGERVAMNMPIQGSAADIIKIAMIRVYNRLKNEKLKSKLILQVHDELIVEAYDDEVMTVKKILKHEMESAVKLDAPLVADALSGKTWYDAKK